MSSNRHDFPETSISSFYAHINYVSYSKFGDDWVSILHSHPFSEILYVIKGKGEFQIENQIMRLEAHDVIVINPNVEHTEKSLAEDPMEYIVLGIEGLEFLFRAQKSQPDLSIPDIFPLFNKINHSPSQNDFSFYFQKILREIEEKKSNYALVCQSILEILLADISRLTLAQLSPIDSKKASKACSTLRRYIDHYYFEPITLDYLANLTHMNKYYLSHAFQKEYGISPINYLIQRRMREGKNLLAGTNHSISYIAYALGFSSQSYFSQAFRRLENISPGQYRLQKSK